MSTLCSLNKFKATFSNYEEFQKLLDNNGLLKLLNEGKSSSKQLDDGKIQVCICFDKNHKGKRIKRRASSIEASLFGKRTDTFQKLDYVQGESQDPKNQLDDELKLRIMELKGKTTTKAVDRTDDNQLLFSIPTVQEKKEDFGDNDDSDPEEPKKESLESHFPKNQLTSKEDKGDQLIAKTQKTSEQLKENSSKHPEVQEPMSIAPPQDNKLMATKEEIDHFYTYYYEDDEGYEHVVRFFDTTKDDEEEGKNIDKREGSEGKEVHTQSPSYQSAQHNDQNEKLKVKEVIVNKPPQKNIVKEEYNMEVDVAEAISLDMREGKQTRKRKHIQESMDDERHFKKVKDNKVGEEENKEEMVTMRSEGVLAYITERVKKFLHI